MSRPCVKCGGTDRNASGQCRPCKRAANIAWGAANPGKKRAIDAAYRAANPEKACAHTATYRAANPDKVRAATAAWVAANQEKIRATTADYYLANKEKCNAATAAYRAANPERIRATCAAWRRANPEKLRIQWLNRRALKNAAGGKLSTGLSAKLFKLQRGKCACGCKQPLGTEFHRDHIMPLALGGPNTDENIQLLRQRCNNQKSAKHPVDFMRQRGFLI